MRYFLAVIVGSIVAGLTWIWGWTVLGGVFMLAPCYAGIENYSIPERIVMGAWFAGTTIGLYGAIPFGVLAGPIAVTIIADKRAIRAHRPR